MTHSTQAKHHQYNHFFMLGCGHSESLTLFNNNAAVHNKKGLLLIDCGHTIKHALHACQLSIANVDAIFITHVHGDHVFGLERIAYETRFSMTRKKKVKLIFHESIYDELWHGTLKGSLGRDSEGNRQLSDYFSLKILKDDANGNLPSFNCLGNRYQLIRVQHTPGKPTFGLLINDYLYFSADSIAMPELMNTLDFTIGFHDVTLRNENPVHASLRSMMEQYPQHIRKKLTLMSYEDHWRMFQPLVDKEFNGFAQQGKCVDIPTIAKARKQSNSAIHADSLKHTSLQAKANNPA